MNLLFRSNPLWGGLLPNAVTLGIVYNRCYMGFGVYSDHSPGRCAGWFSGFCLLLFAVTPGEGVPCHLLLENAEDDRSSPVRDINMTD